MAKKAKEKKKNLKTKDEKFDFDQEIIIGLKKVDENLPKKAVSKKKKKKSKSKKKKSDNFNDVNDVYDQRAQIEERAKQERAKKKRKAIFKLIKWTSFLLIIIGGGIYALLSPIFNVTNINVSGNSKITSDEIISLSKINLDENMFSFRTRDIIANIKENAYIGSVEIHRVIPDTIEISVVERKASFMVKLGNAYALLNNQGYILEISSQKRSFPILEGIKTKQEDIQAGNRLCTEDLQGLGDVLKIMDSAASNGLAQLITKINIANKHDYVLNLEKKKKVVHLGDTSNLSTKMLYILRVNELEKNTPGDIILNMNLNDEKSKPYFRKKV